MAREEFQIASASVRDAFAVAHRTWERTNWCGVRAVARSGTT